MPTNTITRVDPLDLQGNIAMGVSLPFNGPAGPFNSTYSTAEQIKSNLINLLLTNKGERIMNPQFGCDLKKVLFEGLTENTAEVIKQLIITNVGFFIPEVVINNVIVDINSNKYNNPNAVAVTLKYQINISQTPQQITVQFI